MVISHLKAEKHIEEWTAVFAHVARSISGHDYTVVYKRRHDVLRHDLKVSATVITSLTPLQRFFSFSTIFLTHSSSF